MPGEKSVFQINAGIERELRAARTNTWKLRSHQQRRTQISKLIGASDVTVTATNKVVGSIQRDGYRIDKVVLSGNDEQLTLPGLLFVPEKPTRNPVLYLHGKSMKAEADPGGQCEQLVKQGHIVLAAELSGIGETETGHDKRDYGRGRFGRDVQEISLAYLMGRSFVGMRTDDVIRYSNYLARQTSANSQQPIQMIAIGEAAIPALHAAALNPTLFQSVRLKNMIRSWSEVVGAPESLNQLVNTVHGVLRHYDLPDLIELAGKDRVVIEEPVDAMGKAVAVP